MAGKKKRPRKKGPNRNALCPCGSGRAYKNCCAEKRQATADKPDSIQNQLKRIAVGLVVLALIAGGVALAVLRPWEEAPPAPANREYDAENDRYWDAAHGHWHDGRPPGMRAPASSESDVGAPWEYDAIADRHWHPVHGHWHDGPPPPPEQRY